MDVIVGGDSTLLGPDSMKGFGLARRRYPTASTERDGLAGVHRPGRQYAYAVGALDVKFDADGAW